jgi:Family of unknown function (DUF6492)
MPPASNDSPLTFVTPTFARDYERFCLQRESMERCGIDLPHVAIVNHEDLPRFRDMPFQRGLTLVSTRDVLPRRIEQRRLAWGIQRRRNPKFWFSGRGIHGWAVQQLLKLAAPAVVGGNGIVCLDSDTFFVARVTADDFVAPDGRMRLYETTDDLDAQMAEWYAHALRFLGISTVGHPLRRFTHSPVPWRRDVLLDLQKFVAQKHGRDWMEAVIDADRITEYTLYGTYARHVDELRRSLPSPPSLTLSYWWPREVERFAQSFLNDIRSSNFKLVIIQSNVGRTAGEFRTLIEAAWSGGVGAR